MLKKLELKIIPPLVALIMLMFMCLTAALLPQPLASLSTRIIMLGVWVIFGGSIAFLGVMQFLRAKTTVEPKPEKTTALVSSGIYRYTRNPMYLGLTMTLCGFASFGGSVWLFIWVVMFVIYITQFQIKPEERILTKKFPDEYAAYQQRVRRWV